MSTDPLNQASSPPIKRLSQPLVNTKTTVFTLPLEHAANIKALVVSDQHFGKTLPITRSLPQCLKNMMTIIAREQINCIFMLGDIVDNNDKDILTKVFSALEQLPIPVYVMGGGNDRVLIFDYKYNRPGSNVRVVYDYAIRIHNPNAPVGTPQNIFLAHDLCNPLSVKPDEAEAFLVALKRAFKKDIANEDFLIIGHTHQYVFNEDLRCASIKDFSPDNHHNGYAVISTGSNGFKINIVGK